MPELVRILEEGRTDEWYAFAWLEETISRSATAGKIENVGESLDRGMVLRLLAGGVSYERSTNLLQEEHLLAFAKGFRLHVEEATAKRKGIVPNYVPRSWDEELKHPLHPEFLEQIPDGVNSASWVHFSPDCAIDPYETTCPLLVDQARAYRAKVVQKSDEYIKNHPGTDPLSDVRVLMRQTIKTQIFVDRTRNLSQLLPISLAYPIGIAKGGLSAREVRGGLGGLEITTLDDEAFSQAGVAPHLLAKAERLKPGRYKLITGPDVTGVIAHEAFGHTQEGDTWMKGRSIATDLRSDGVKVGNDDASIVNQAALFSMDDLSHGTNGSYYFDHEGELARPQTILDRGMLSTPMTDLVSALVLGVPRTANGKRESWRRPLMARQTNTFFTPGKETLDDLIKRVEYGFLARHAHGGMEDPKGGSLTAGTDYLEEIRDGKLTGKLFLGPSGGHVELSDPVFTLLSRILGKTGTGNRENLPENKYGGCGKYHKESVEAGCGGPYILWESINCG